MSNIAIRVENLGKMYRIGGHQEKYATLRDAITNVVTAPFNKVRRVIRGEAASGLKEEIWALKGVSFEVNHGEVVGIIGRNGAGKSTLLKILSRITEPTTGYIDIYGRVGALLEVGTGFHPELTGRENIYLNGAILGMTRRDIDRKFDEIVDFAGVDRFIDTPVKHYSSGMGLRLGFSVAAHLEPEILIVDEVLAVGDAEFQRKCLGKMSSVANEGRTVLFVSHNMSSINALCTRCLWLHQGGIFADGNSHEIIQRYLALGSENIHVRHWDQTTAPGDEIFRLLSAAIMKSNDEVTERVKTTEDITIEIVFNLTETLPHFRIGFDLVSPRSELLFRSYFDDYSTTPMEFSKGYHKLRAIIPRNLLNAGQHYIDIRAGMHGIKRILLLERALTFEVINVDGINIRYGGNKEGLIAPYLCWTIVPSNRDKQDAAAHSDPVE